MLLKIIRDADLGFPYTLANVAATRIAARALLTDADGNLALMHAQAKDIYKLPGGGLEGDETPEQALHRELMEETGCAAIVTAYIGYLEEHKGGEDGFVQVSHLFRATVKGGKGLPQFDTKEQAMGFHLLWVAPEEATRLLATQSTHGEYRRAFMVEREKQLIAYL